MNKKTVLQAIGSIVIILGAIIVFNVTTSDQPNISVLAGIGPMITGFAILFISKSKAFNKD